MKKLILTLAILLGAGVAFADDDLFDRVDDALTFNADQGAIRARFSGTVDLEGYSFQQPAPAFIASNGTSLFIPRLTLFLDAQLGPYIYAFVQSRVDRGFDPSNNDLRLSLDEAAVRITPWLDSRFNLQVGKFATVVGNWTPRHLSWDNPFITAPLPYENLTGIWDLEPAKSASTLALWANVGAKPSTAFPIKSRSLPIIWGPSYATGASASGALGKFDYAVEVKGSALSSRPQDWDPDSHYAWEYPTTSARLGFRPDNQWTFGVSASTGGYLLPSAVAFVPVGYNLGSYRETLFGQDIAYAWHNWQVWAEVFETRFAVPRVGNADTAAYYLETRYKFTERFFFSTRWNQQLFATLPNGTAPAARWGSNLWRIDLAPTYRLTAHIQFKLQYSFQREDIDIGSTNQLLASQLTIRF